MYWWDQHNAHPLTVRLRHLGDSIHRGEIVGWIEVHSVESPRAARRVAFGRSAHVVAPNTVKTMLARVPASSANLGPGFDSLAVALTLYLEVTLELADAFAISSEGCGAGLFDDESNLGARVAADVLGHSNFSMHVKSEIPLSTRTRLVGGAWPSPPRWRPAPMTR